MEGIQVPSLMDGVPMEYKWPSNFIAISRDINQYMSISSSEAEMCNSQGTTLCRSTNPVYNPLMEANCLVSFSTQHPHTAQNCLSERLQDKISNNHIKLMVSG